MYQRQADKLSDLSDVAAPDCWMGKSIRFLWLISIKNRQKSTKLLQ